jgi:transketolase C-terminal domain/subunit
MVPVDGPMKTLTRYMIPVLWAFGRMLSLGFNENTGVGLAAGLAMHLPFPTLTKSIYLLLSLFCNIGLVYQDT